MYGSYNNSYFRPSLPPPQPFRPTPAPCPPQPVPRKPECCDPCVEMLDDKLNKLSRQVKKMAECLEDLVDSNKVIASKTTKINTLLDRHLLEQCKELSKWVQRKCFCYYFTVSLRPADMTCSTEWPVMVEVYWRCKHGDKIICVDRGVVLAQVIHSLDKNSSEKETYKLKFLNAKWEEMSDSRTSEEIKHVGELSIPKGYIELRPMSMNIKIGSIKYAFNMTESAQFPEKIQNIINEITNDCNKNKCRKYDDDDEDEDFDEEESYDEEDSISSSDSECSSSSSSSSSSSVVVRKKKAPPPPPKEKKKPCKKVDEESLVMIPPPPPPQPQPKKIRRIIRRRQ